MSNIRQRDLSIGDWVNAGGEPAKIIQLGIVGRNKAKGLSGQMYGFLTSSEIKPIPITSEILKSNGWYEDDELVGFFKDNPFDSLIDCIEWLIGKGYFNKEYLKE